MTIQPAAHEDAALQPLPAETIATWPVGTFLENILPLPDGGFVESSTPGHTDAADDLSDLLGNHHDMGVRNARLRDAPQDFGTATDLEAFRALSASARRIWPAKPSHSGAYCWPSAKRPSANAGAAIGKSERGRRGAEPTFRRRLTEAALPAMSSRVKRKIKQTNDIRPRDGVDDALP